jgi:hypothetical protein
LRALYRSRQFFSSLRPRVDPALRAEASGYLNEAQQGLFDGMMPRDQQHCLNVFERLRSEGQTDRDLLAAALLHDSGKGRIALWHRVAFVLLQAGAPSLLGRIARPGDGGGAREALYRCLHDDELGAGLAREAGSSERTVALISGEGGEALREPLSALRAADDSV